MTVYNVALLHHNVALFQYNVTLFHYVFLKLTACHTRAYYSRTTSKVLPTLTSGVQAVLLHTARTDDFVFAIGPLPPTSTSSDASTLYLAPTSVNSPRTFRVFTFRSSSASLYFVVNANGRYRNGGGLAPRLRIT